LVSTVLTDAGFSAVEVGDGVGVGVVGMVRVGVGAVLVEVPIGLGEVAVWGGVQLASSIKLPNNPE
jgi:hypothetical protein